MQSLSTTARKLILALNMDGQRVSLEQKCFFSRSYDKMMTKYTVKRTDPATGRREKLLEAYSLAKVVTLLAELYAEQKEA